MVLTRAKGVLSISVACLALGAFSASCEKEKSQERSEAQADKERLIESRKEQQQTRGDLRDAVKSGSSKEDLQDLKNQVKEGQKGIVQDKKNIREQRLGSTKDQSDANQGTKPPTE
jgi:septal ring factor EnvC (AmiA/AmiB activator)